MAVPDKKKDDPTKDPDFMRVVDHFLKTPHKPHKPTKDTGKSPAKRGPPVGQKSPPKGRA